MRNLKKILALVLALVMSMSLVSVAGAYYTVDSYSDSDMIAEEYLEAVAVLDGIGVFQGDEGKFNPTDSITRAEVATIIYRIMTGDVEGKGAQMYADMNKFADCEGHWAAGYINFCANQNIVQGYNPTTFGPDDAITGYQAVLMLLRAIGWDKNGESNGDDWREVSASKAQLMGWTAGVSDYTLSQDAQRQLVAHILLRAIQAPQYTWTMLMGYNEYKTWEKNPGDLNPSLGYENFRLAYDYAIQHDDWGRPYHVWFIDASGNGFWGNYKGLPETIVAVDAYAPVKTYTEATPDCDVAEALDLTRPTAIDRLTVNGYWETSESCDAFADGIIEPTKVKETIGAQGRLTEFYVTYDARVNEYYYEVVMIDEFLAEVTDVTEVKLDKNDHIDKYAKLYLEVWYAEGLSTELVLESEENWEYEEGDFLLINAKTAGSDCDDIIVDGTIITEVYNILGLAETETSKQYAHSNEDSHYIKSLDEDIPDAIRYAKDEAEDNSKDEFVWFFDTNGNIIGSDLVETVEEYCTIKNIWWVDSRDGEDGYAKATIVLMDGTTTTMKVTHVAGIKLESAEGASYVSYDDGIVSSTKQHNTAAFAFKALYEIDGAKLVETTELPDAQLVPGVPELTTAINANNKTLFLINEGSKGCNPYTGIKNVPDYKAVDDVWYVDLNGDNHAEYVFVGSVTAKSSSTTTKDTYHTFFAFSDDRLIVKNKLDGKLDIEYFEISGGMVDGEEAKIKIKKDAAGVGEGHKDELLANRGRLMYITVNNGYVTEVAVVNAGGAQVLTSGDYVVYAGKAHKGNGTYLKGGVFEDENGNSYNVEDAEEISYDGTLKSSYNHDAAAELFFVFAKKGNNDEQIVKLIYITDKDGAAAPTTPSTPTNPDAPLVGAAKVLDDTKKAVDEIEALIAAAKAELGLSATTPSADSKDAHESNYAEIKVALDVVNDPATGLQKKVDDALADTTISAEDAAALATLRNELKVLEKTVMATLVAIAQDAYEDATDMVAAIAAIEATGAKATYAEYAAATAKLAAANNILSDTDLTTPSTGYVAVVDDEFKELSTAFNAAQAAFELVDDTDYSTAMGTLVTEALAEAILKAKKAVKGEIQKAITADDNGKLLANMAIDDICKDTSYTFATAVAAIDGGATYSNMSDAYDAWIAAIGAVSTIPEGKTADEAVAAVTAKFKYADVVKAFAAKVKADVEAAKPVDASVTLELIAAKANLAKYENNTLTLHSSVTFAAGDWDAYLQVVTGSKYDSVKSETLENGTLTLVFAGKNDGKDATLTITVKTATAEEEAVMDANGTKAANIAKLALIDARAKTVVVADYINTAVTQSKVAAYVKNAFTTVINADGDDDGSDPDYAVDTDYTIAVEFNGEKWSAPIANENVDVEFTVTITVGTGANAVSKTYVVAFNVENANA